MNKKRISYQHNHRNSTMKQFSRRPLGVVALFVIALFCLAGIYAPFLASSKPLTVWFDGEWYFPLFRYLFYTGFYSKPLDIFYNLLMFTLPLFILCFYAFGRQSRWRNISLGLILLVQLMLFAYFTLKNPRDPASNRIINDSRSTQKTGKHKPLLETPKVLIWERELQQMTPYTKLNMLLSYRKQKLQNERLKSYEPAYAKEMEKRGLRDLTFIPTLWNLNQRNEADKIRRESEIVSQHKNEYPQAKAWISFIKETCSSNDSGSGADHSQHSSLTCDFLPQFEENNKGGIVRAKEIVDRYEAAQAKILYIESKRAWLEENILRLRYIVNPLLSPFHWEEDAGGNQTLNRHIGWLDLTRINRKDMMSALIFGIRISLSVGITAVGLALAIGIPIGAISGFYGGTIDVVTYRLIEIWESMPTFFMLLMVVAFLKSKSILIIVAVIGLFGWTSFSRFVRGEFLRQKQLPYVEACRAMGFNDAYIIFFHLLPNAIPPLLTLVPFAVMGAVTSEAGLSFLGLGEEGSGSWGVLMDEGRSAFPSESYLLWPPAILLTIFLVAIALTGDAFRDALDPKLHRSGDLE
jgi:peptide/nickel transport system permease protein